MNVELGSPKRDAVKFTLFDTHAMAYKLMLMESGCDESGEISQTSLSEHGKEARMDFYLNRSRSDGASSAMKACLDEMKKHKLDEPQSESIDRSQSFDSKPRKRLNSEPSIKPDVKQSTKEPVEINDAQNAAQRLSKGPILYIPNVDSSEHLLTYDRNNACNNGERKKLFAQHRFVPYFALPSPAFIMHCLLDERRICLESLESSRDARFSATILVKRTPGSRACGTRVYCRRTLDDWRTYEDIEAKFVEISNERSNVDRFRVSVDFAAQIQPGTRLELALAYEIRASDGRSIVYWDNNNQANYAFWYSG